MNSKVGKIMRSIQVNFPFLQDYKFQMRREIRNLLNQAHEKDFDALALLPRSSNNLFLDVGANRGEAIQSILMKRPDAKVMAFEPNRFLAEKTRKVYKNEARVEIHNIGLGSTEGSYELFIPFYNNFMFDGLASFKETRARNWLVNRLYGFNRKKLEVKKMVCQVKPLDDLALKPYFIKIDVQGYEYEVLRGATNTLTEHKPILLIETPGEGELQFLLSLGYESFFYQNSKFYRGKNGQNVFFVHEKQIELILKDKRMDSVPPRPVLRPAG